MRTHAVRSDEQKTKPDNGTLEIDHIHTRWDFRTVSDSQQSGVVGSSAMMVTYYVVRDMRFIDVVVYVCNSYKYEQESNKVNGRIGLGENALSSSMTAMRI